MSMGPKEKIEKFETTISDRANIAFKKVVSSYLEDPIGKLFYCSLAVCVIGLIFGRIFPFPFYLILGILSIVEAYKYFEKKSEDKIIINEVNKSVQDK